jgi:hypothetical protein
MTWNPEDHYAPNGKPSQEMSAVEPPHLPVRWGRAENVRWSVKLLGWGTSSPVVYGIPYVPGEKPTVEKPTDEEKGSHP